MTQTQVLAHLLQCGRATAPGLAKKFSETTLRAHQSLLRLQRKGLVKKEKVGYRVKFELTKKAKILSGKIKEDNNNLSYAFFLGLAYQMLPLSSGSKEESDETHRN